MDIRIIAVGRAGNRPEATLTKNYLDRLPWKTTLIEVEEKRPIKGPERQKREAALLLNEVPDGALLFALDERGKSLDSVQFAKVVEAALETGKKTLVFVIGGADGLQEGLRARADRLISLSAMTWPHMLARVMLTEQLYRAAKILEGHPYHKA